MRQSRILVLENARDFRQELVTGQQSGRLSGADVTDLEFFQCFDTVGWSTGRHLTCRNLLPKVLFCGNQVQPAVTLEKKVV